MKERIVVDVQEYCKQCKKQSCRTKYCWLKRKKDEGRFEQVPETFEDLKELCEDLEGKNVFITCGGECIEFNGLYFWKDGSITTTQNNNDIWATKTNLTPARQWNIIKSLIGEE